MHWWALPADVEARRLLGGAAADIAHLASLFTVTLSDLGVASQAIRGVANGSVFEPPVLVFDVPTERTL